MARSISPSVYIMSNISGSVLYTGVTSDLEERVREHRRGDFGGFTSRYAICKVVFVERHPTMMSAIEREKQIKSWSRRRKAELIHSLNPTWQDLMPNDEL